MFDGMFRKEAFGSKNDRLQLDRLLTFTLHSERVVVVLIGILILLTSAWILFGSVTRSVSAEGVLIAPGVRHEVAAVEPGRLVEFLLAPGDRVAAGEPIARQTAPALDREMAILAARATLLESGSTPPAGVGGDAGSLLQAARMALLQLEASRSAREVIVSPVAGEIMALHASPGDYLAAGTPLAQLRENDDGLLRAVAWITPAAAQGVEPGQEALVEILSPDGTRRGVRGEIASVGAEPPAGWLAALLPDAAGRRVDIALELEPEFSPVDGVSCSIRIFLSRQAPVSLLLPARS